MFMVSHTWGRSMDTDSYDGKATRFYRPGDNDYGRSIFDIRQRFVASVNYAIPFGKTRRTVRFIVGRLGAESILALQTGLAFPCNGHRPFQHRHNFRRTAEPASVTESSFRSAYGLSLVRYSLLYESALNTYGNGGVHYLDTDGNKTLDIGIFKNFRFTSERPLQFRWEVFNALNNTNYNRPGSNVSSPATLGISPGATGANDAVRSEVLLLIQESWRK